MENPPDAQHEAASQDAQPLFPESIYAVFPASVAAHAHAIDLSILGGKCWEITGQEPPERLTSDPIATFWRFFIEGRVRERYHPELTGYECRVEVSSRIERGQPQLLGSGSVTCPDAERKEVSMHLELPPRQVRDLIDRLTVPAGEREGTDGLQIRFDVCNPRRVRPVEIAPEPKTAFDVFRLHCSIPLPFYRPSPLAADASPPAADARWYTRFLRPSECALIADQRWSRRSTLGKLHAHGRGFNGNRRRCQRHFAGPPAKRRSSSPRAAPARSLGGEARAIAARLLPAARRSTKMVLFYAEPP